MHRQFWGVVLTAVGVTALMQMTMGYHFGLAFWPVVLVLAGVGILWSSFLKFQWFGLALGLWIGGIGLADILYNAGVSTITGGDITRNGWPLLLVAIGVSLIFRRRSVRWGFRYKGEWKNGTSGKLVGDVRMGQSNWTLENDLRIDQGIGDIKVDLTTAEIPEGTHRVYVHAGIGDVVIRVPDDVNVIAAGKVGIGDLEVLGDHRSGFGCQARKVINVADSAIILEIEAEMGVGDMNIVLRPASTVRVIK